MTATNYSRFRGFGKGIGIAIITLGAALAGDLFARLVGISPELSQGVFGGVVLGAFLWYMVGVIQSMSPLVDATSRDRIHFDEPKKAKITLSHHEPLEEDVFAIETDPMAGYPFKVWVMDESGKEYHPYYAKGVEFVDDFNE